MNSPENEFDLFFYSHAFSSSLSVCASRNQDIEWPQDDEALSTEAVEAVEKLLTMDPELRPSSKDVKLMPFFQTIDWDNLQVMEPPFIPQPENATDTGYFEGKNADKSS